MLFGQVLRIFFVLQQMTAKNVLMLLLTQVRGGPATKRIQKDYLSLHPFHF